MNKAFEKILDRLEDTKDIEHDDSIAEVVSTRIWNKAIHRAKQIVNEVAEEYNGGWIPCSERLPSGLDFVLYTHKDGEVDICSIEYFYDYLDKFTAWQPLPERFKERD